MNLSVSGSTIDIPSSALSQRPSCQLQYVAPTLSPKVYMCVYLCVCVSVWACVRAYIHVCSATEQDPIWFAPLACEARLWGSTSLYSPNGFPSPLLLTSPQTPVMCTLVNIHTWGSRRGREGRRGKHRLKKTKRVWWEKWNKRETKCSETGGKKGRVWFQGAIISFKEWPWSWALQFNLQILTALDGQTYLWGDVVWIVTVLSVWHRWSSGAAEVKLSVAIATHSILLQYIQYMVLHLPLPP